MEQFSQRIPVEALSGTKMVRVLGSLPHNYCALLLADLGADIIKVQPLLARRETAGQPMRDKPEAIVDVHLDCPCEIVH